MTKLPEVKPKIRPWVCICGTAFQSSEAWRTCYNSHKDTVMHNGVRHVKVLRKRTV